MYHGLSDTDINYKPSRKNVQIFHVVRFLTKIVFVPRGYGAMWRKIPPSQTKLKTFRAKSGYRQFWHKIKNNIIKKINRSPIEIITEIPMISIKLPL